MSVNNHMFVANLNGLKAIYPKSGLLQSMGLEEMEALSKKAKIWPNKTIFPSAPSEYYAYKFAIILDVAAKSSDLKEIFVFSPSGINPLYSITEEDINAFADYFDLRNVSTVIDCKMLRNKALNITQEQWDTYQKGLKELVVSKRKVPDHIMRRVRMEQRAADRAATEELERGYFAKPESDADFVEYSDIPDSESKESFRKPAVKTAEDRLVYRDRSGSGSSRQQLRNDAKLVGKLLSSSI